MKNKSLKILSLFASVTLMSACGFSNESSKDDSSISSNVEREFDMNLVEDSKSSKIIKDYAYMYHIDGIHNEKDRLGFFSDNYQMMVDTKSARLMGLKATDKEEMVDPDNLSLVESKFEIEINNTKYELLENGEGRILDSGRYVNRYDNVTLTYDGLDANKYFGRIEYVTNRDYIMLNYELYSLNNVQYTLISRLTLDGYTLTKVDDRSIMAIDENGNGFIFSKQSLADNTDLIIEGNTVVIKKSVVDYNVKSFRGMGVVIIPYYNDSNACYDRFIANEKLRLSATTVNGIDLQITYDPTDGVHYIDHDSIPCQASSNNYDDLSFAIKNDSSLDARPVICFMKSRNVSITGVSPMVLDFDSYEPTGETVQISKNWHTYTNNSSDFNYAPADSPKRFYQGPWLHSYTRINVNRGEEQIRKFMLAYGKWGSAYAVSHSQLCLVGYSGLQVWDQSALGSWGETVTYDPDIGLNRSMIDDVRPFLVTSPIGNNMQHNWTGNVGGADFLRYSTDEGRQGIVNQRLSYITQAPSITNVNYSGVTKDNKIKTSITINMGRTDDIPRNYYTLEYEFLDDVTYSELTFFKLCANSYSDNKFTKYAYGDINGIIEENLLTSGAAENVCHTAENSDFFFGLYNSTDVDENGDVMLCVREYEANVNGQTYNKPGYKLVDTHNGTKQVACEIGLPSEFEGVVKKGSKVKLVIEYDILPNSNTYYGESQYIIQTKEVMGTALEFYQQVFGGKLDLKVTNGHLVSTYPINIYSKGDDSVSFSLSGGLGYTQLFLDGLSGYSGYKLQMKTNGEYQDVDQSSSNYDHDFYQCYYNERTNKYQFGFNIFNTKGTNFAGATNEYRLVKVK